MSRSCQECSLCCYLPRVVELDKPAVKWCQHCTKTHGCGIYPDRPDVCKNFECMWLWNEKFPEEMKPNVAKMYFALAPAQDAIQVYVHPQHREKWREPGPQAVIEYFRRQAIHVIIMHGDQRTFLNGYGAALPQEIAKLVEDEHPYVK